MDDPGNHVEIRSLSFNRGARVIFDGVDINIVRGRITAILGPSGTGKTTLLRLIGGQLQPDAGSVLVEGRDLAGLSRSGMYAVRSRMGMLFQSGALFTDLSVYENVAFPLRAHTRLPEAMLRDLVLLKLNAVGLRGARDLMPSELSGGMARRVALARAIALDPDLVMFDEPFAGQDPIAMGVLVKLIKSLNQSVGVTSVIVSHDVPETLSIADYIYVISNGRVIGQGAPAEVMKSASPEVRQFMRGEPDGPVPFHYPSRSYREDMLREGLSAEEMSRG
ncbi:MAG: ATP-binding cassette domain-containing protein [Pseudomonadota bacterium]